MRRRTSTVLAGLVGLAVTLSMAVPAVQAAPARAAGSTATVQDQLVLEPTDFGYRGSIQAELTYQGVEPARARYVITEPVPGSYENLEWGVTCYSGGERLPDRRIRVECDIPGGEFQPGEHRAFTIDFQVLTTIQPYAMKAKNGRLAITVNGKVVTNETFQSRFRSSTGSLRNPVTYVRDQQPDAGITAGDLTLVRQPDGTFEGRLPLTVRYDSDAPHYDLDLLIQNLPAGLYEAHAVPEAVCGFCAPGGQFMQGEARNFDFVFTGSADTRLGDLGEASIEVRADAWWPQALPDADPSDNVTTFSITAVEAG